MREGCIIHLYQSLAVGTRRDLWVRYAVHAHTKDYYRLAYR